MFAQISFGAYVLASVYGVLYLVKEREDAGEKSAGRLPEAKLLDELSFRLILFGFFAETVMLAIIGAPLGLLVAWLTVL